MQQCHQSMLIKNIVGRWYELHETKGISGVQVKYEVGKINLIQGKKVDYLKKDKINKPLIYDGSDRKGK